MRDLSLVIRGLAGRNSYWLADDPITDISRCVRISACRLHTGRRSTSVMKSRVTGTALRLLRAATETSYVSREEIRVRGGEMEFPLADCTTT